MAERQEAGRVAEFTQRLEMNMGRFATGLAQVSRMRVAPPRPKEGWSLLVKPLGAGAPEPFVAKPDGSARALSQMESEYQERMRVKPRRKADVDL